MVHLKCTGEICPTAIQDLSSLFFNVNILTEITKNSFNNVSNFITWNEILHGVHSAVTQGGEKNFKASEETIRKNAANLFSEIVSHGIRVLNASDVVSLILQILGSKAFQFCYLTYLNSLTTHILPDEKCQNNITREQWQELLKVCVRCYRDQSPTIKKEKILNAIQLIVHYGCSISHLVLRTRKLILFLAEVFEDMQTNDSLVDSALKLGNTVCSQAAAQSRLLLCSFGETIMSTCINLKRCNEKYELLLILLQAHHPAGFGLSEEIATAVNSDTWRNLLFDLYCMILQEHRNIKDSEKFYDFSAEVFKQVVQDPILSERIFSQIEIQGIGGTKRRKISSDDGSFIPLIAGSTPEAACPMLQIFSRLFKKYPTILKPGEYITALQTLSSLFMQSSNSLKVVDTLYELGIALINVGSHLDLQVIAESSRVFWSEIIDTITSYLNKKQNQETVHQFLRYYIENLKLMNKNPILKSYVTKAMPWSLTSLETLLKICRHTILPESLNRPEGNANLYLNNMSPLEMELLKWLSGVSWKKLITLDSILNLSELLIGLTLKYWRKESLKSDQKYSKIEELYLVIELAIDIFDTSAETRSQTSWDSSKRLHGEINLQFLYTQLDDFLKESNKGDSVRILVVKCALIARILADLKEIGVLQNDLHELPLVHLMQRFLGKIFKIFAESDLTTLRHKNLMQVMKVLRILFQTTTDRSINKIIMDSISLHALQNIYGFLKDNLSSHADNKDDIMQMRNEDDFSSKDTLTDRANKAAKRISVTKTLNLYCHIPADDSMHNVQEQLFCSLSNTGHYDFTSNTDLEIILMILEISGNIKTTIHTKTSIEIVLDLLIEIFVYIYKDQIKVHRILRLIPKFFKLALQLDQSVLNIVKIIIYFHNLIQEKNTSPRKSYGPSIHIDFLKCIQELILLDPTFKFLNQIDPNNEDFLIVECLLEYVNSPFLEVRLEAARCINLVFESPDVEFKYKMQIFERLKILLENAFITNRKLDEKEMPDERKLRIASTLHLLTAVIRGSHVLRDQALFLLIYHAARKKIDTKIVDKALWIALKERKIVEKNLDHLIMQWLQLERSIDSFPWNLTHCRTKDEFHSNHMQIILSSLIKAGNLSEAVNLCNQQGLDFRQEFEQSFPSVIAWLLSQVAVSSSASSAAEATLRKIQTNQDEFKYMRRFLDLVHDNLNQIIVLLIKELHDESNFAELFGWRIKFPESNCARLTTKAIDECLLYIQEHFLMSKKLIQYLATDHCHVIQKILLKLTRNIYESDNELKPKTFHQYVYFCNLIAQKIKDIEFVGISPFVIRDICCTLSNLLDVHQYPIQEAACKYLHRFLQMILPEKAIVVKEMYNKCIESLTRWLINNEKSFALKTLQFLVDTQRDLFIDVITTLDFFPNLPVFESLNEIYFNLSYNDMDSVSLESDIEHFFKMSSATYSSGSESLVRLWNQLSSKRKELGQLYENLESKTDPTMESPSELQKLIRQLLSLINRSNPHISQEAAKCLGYLGPGNLATMILHPDKLERRYQLNRLEMLTHRILIMLYDLIIDKNIEIRDAGAEALYLVLSSPWGEKMAQQKYLKEFESAMGSGESRLSIDHMRPFLPTADKCHDYKSIRMETCPDLLEDYWIEKASGPYSSWIVQFALMISQCFQNSYIGGITAIFKLNVQFSEKIIPWMVNVLFEDPELKSDICGCINRFFQYYFLSSRDRSRSSNKPKNPSCTHESVRCMLEIMKFVWVQTDKTERLDLDYLHIALGAQFCSAYFTSILCAELWCDSFLNGNRDVGSALIIDYIIETDPVRGRILQDIIREAYVKIGDPDAIHGCGSMHLLDPASRIQHYIDLKQWDKAMLMQDIEMSCGVDFSRDVLYVLQQTGLYYLLNQLMSNMKIDENERCNNDYKYECAWRLGDWTLLDTKRNPPDSSLNLKDNERNQSYHFHHYRALKFLNEKDIDGVKESIDKARSCVIEYLHNISLESCKAMYPMLSNLQILREIEELISVDSSGYDKYFQDWKYYNYVKNNDFEYVEALFSHRIAICRIMQSQESNTVIKNALIDTHLELIQCAEEREHFRVATRALDSLAKLEDLPQNVKNQLCYLEARLARKQNNQHIGQFLLNLLIDDSSTNPSLRAQALLLFGNWMGEIESGNPQEIIKKYYQGAINILESIVEKTCENLKNLHETQAALARFSDMQYRQISEYIKSPQFKTLKSFAELSTITPNSNEISDRDLRRAVTIHKKQSINDVAELESFENDKNMYLLLALEYYLKTLEQSRDHDFLIFRVISLWLDNTHHATFNKVLNNHLPKIASYKFVPLIPQLAPHLNLSKDQFSSKIHDIIRKCALEHPHHTLPVLLALKNMDGDSEFSKCQVSTSVEPKPRVVAAQKLIDQLLQTEIRPIIKEMSLVSRSLVMLAYLEVQRGRVNEKYPIPYDQAICKIRCLNNTVVPTMTLSVRANGKYNDIVGIREYKSTFVTVGGMNAPKRIECIGTDGICRRQLIKGQDDMRQDAVMQQVFTVINSLLSTKKDTRERKLRIRTYKVVPLTQRSGVLEWCENTLPIASIVIGNDRNSGLHRKYYPNDYTAMKCRKKMESVLRESNEVKLKTFLECCKNMRPAFHHFFTEQYLSPEVWFERRLTYTRSVATTSIVGYVLSVGDRHLQNILLDQTTAEVIHIDFGIAFEQGKLLTIPETVPFRLTRDIEVPMGVSGVEGVMRRSCEQTLKLLQEQREIIITLLQVLLYDPLFTWTISSSRVPHRIPTNISSTALESSHFTPEINKFANRALLKVQQKLQGVEEGVTLSVQGQVERLIQQARDPNNLSLLFHGWQAYL